MRRTARTLASLALVALAACTGDGDPAAEPTPSVTPPLVSGSRTPSPSPRPATPSAAPSPRAGTPRLELVGRFDQPVHVVAPPGGDRLFVVEKGGRIVVRSGGRTLRAPLLDLAGQVSTGSEQGLLSMALSPDFGRDRLFYVNYTDREGDTRVVEYAVSATDPDRADPGSRRELLRVGQPYGNHNGGLLLFDPDGMLVVGLGDGGSGGDPENRGQRLDTLLGKLLRIDPRPSGGRPYGVPRDNPFVGRDGARPEIWAYGLRNPWRFWFDPRDRTLYLADVGQNRWEEVNVVPRDRQPGANYGWRAFEGRERFRDQRIDRARLVTPVAGYGHDADRCSIVGGQVYRGSAAALRDRYLYGDTCTGEVWSIPAGARERAEPRREAFGGGALVSFGEDTAGEVYLVSLRGEVWRITV